MRDLLGVLRALYASTPAEHRTKRAAIAAVAKDLLDALELAGKAATRSVGHSAAWTKAERAVSKLADLVDVTTPAEPVLAAAGLRVRRRRE